MHLQGQAGHEDRLFCCTGLFGSEDEGTMIVTNVMNWLPNTASHSIRPASLATPLQEPKISLLTTAYTTYMWDQNLWCSRPGTHTLNHHKTVQAVQTETN